MTQTTQTLPPTFEATTGQTPEGFLVVSYGMGLDSTAILAEMSKRGIRPDMIIFSDTGAEKPATYAFLPIINSWLRSVGFPEVTVVKFVPTRAPYTTLEGKSLANEVMPSLAYGQHQCALIFKRDVIWKFLKTNARVLAAIASGKRIINIIGYDDSTADRKRSAKAGVTLEILRERVNKRAREGKAPLADQWQSVHSNNWYPLQGWNLERTALAAIVKSVGLEVPGKSACFFCPASKPAEVVELKRDHPELFERAVAIEAKAKNGKHAAKATKVGLGMGNWSWESLRDVTDPALAAAHLRSLGIKVSDAARP